MWRMDYAGRNPPEFPHTRCRLTYSPTRVPRVYARDPAKFCCVNLSDKQALYTLSRQERAILMGLNPRMRKSSIRAALISLRPNQAPGTSTRLKKNIPTTLLARAFGGHLFQPIRLAAVCQFHSDLTYSLSSAAGILPRCCQGAESNRLCQ